MSKLYQLKHGQVTVADAIPGRTVTDEDVLTLKDVTAGTAAAGKVLVLDGAKAIGTLGNVGMGALTATTGAFSGAIEATAITGSGIVQGSQLKAREYVVAATASGAVTIPAYSQTVVITKSSAPAALTIADPTNETHDGVMLTFISATAKAHTLDNSAGSGFNGGGAGVDVATFGGAIGDNLTIAGYGGKWFVVGSVNVTLG